MTRILSPTYKVSLRSLKVSHHGTHLVLWRIIELGVVALTVPVVKKMVVHQVPAPALFVRAKQGHVAVTLGLCLLSSDTDDSHSSERALPYDFPGVATTAEPDLPPGPISTLRHGVSVESEPIGFNVNIVGAVCRVPSVIKCS